MLLCCGANQNGHVPQKPVRRRCEASEKAVKGADGCVPWPARIWWLARFRTRLCSLMWTLPQGARTARSLSYLRPEMCPIIADGLLVPI